jgi:hypothetical protein
MSRRHESPDLQKRLILSVFAEPHLLHASVRSSNSRPNRIGVMRIMTISVPQIGHVDDAPASGGISWLATRFPFAEARQRIPGRHPPWPSNQGITLTHLTERDESLLIFVPEHEPDTRETLA